MKRVSGPGPGDPSSAGIWGREGQGTAAPSSTMLVGRQPEATGSHSTPADLGPLAWGSVGGGVESQKRPGAGHADRPAVPTFVSPPRLEVGRGAGDGVAPGSRPVPVARHRGDPIPPMDQSGRLRQRRGCVRRERTRVGRGAPDVSSTEPCGSPPVASSRNGGWIRTPTRKPDGLGPPL